MKKITAYKAALALMSLVGAVSCSDLKFGNDFLEKAPGVDVTIDTVFSCKKYADRALNAAYLSVPCGLVLNNNATNGHFGASVYMNNASVIGNDSLDALTDIIQTSCSWGGCKSIYYTGSYSAATEDGGGGKFCYANDRTFVWTGIRKAYLYMDNVDRVPDMTDEEKALRKAECKMIIATNYLHALRHIGGVPLFYDAVDASNQDADFSRKTVQQVLDFICNLCDEAAEVLPWQVEDADFGRFSKGAALALKARALLFCASPLFNAPESYMPAQQPSVQNADKVTEDPALMIWMGDYQQKRWQDAADACKAFLDANDASARPYKLVMPVGTEPSDYRWAFSDSYGTRCNNEIILAGGLTTTTFWISYHLYYMGCSYYVRPGGYEDFGVGYGGGDVTLDYVDLFQNTDGTPSSYKDYIKTMPYHDEIEDVKDEEGNVVDQKATRYYDGNVNFTPFQNKDPRLYESVMIPADKFRNRIVEGWLGGVERGMEGEEGYISGFHIRKYMWDFDQATFGNRPFCWSVIRLPEVYLSYAEALNELGRTDEALFWLNKTRQRVGLPDMTMELLQANHGGKDLPKYNYLTGNAMLREEILDERAREFALEDVRWFDLARWKREDILHKRYSGVKVKATTYPAPDGATQNTPIPAGVPQDAYLMDRGLSYAYELHFPEPMLLEERAQQASKTFNPKWYLSAFPTKEVNKGYGLVQNPGW